MGERDEATAEQAAPPRTATAQHGDRLAVLDGLRGIAILMVTVVHFASAEIDAQLETGSLLERAYAKLATHGTAGVDLFFVLSGFLITRILLRTREQPLYLRNFYMRRVLRIFPLYYVALAVVYLVLMPHVFPHSEANERMVGQQGWLWLYASNVAQSFFNVHWRGGSVHLDHFWSLAVEEHFYLVWPFLVLVLGRRGLLRACAVMVVMALALKVVFVGTHMMSAAYLFTASRADGLAIGAVIAMQAQQRGNLAPFRRLAWRLLGATTACLIALAAASGRFWWTTALTHSVYPLFFGAAMVLALTAPADSPLTRVLSGKVFGFFGRYSYGLYVWHAMLVPVFVGAISVPRLQAAAGSRLGGLAIFYAVCLSISCVLALLSWHLLEKHFLMLKRAFEAPAPLPKAFPERESRIA